MCVCVCLMQFHVYNTWLVICCHVCLFHSLSSRAKAWMWLEPNKHIKWFGRNDGTRTSISEGGGGRWWCFRRWRWDWEKDEERKNEREIESNGQEKMTGEKEAIKTNSAESMTSARFARLQACLRIKTYSVYGTKLWNFPFHQIRFHFADYTNV